MPRIVPMLGQLSARHTAAAFEGPSIHGRAVRYRPTGPFRKETIDMNTSDQCTSTSTQAPPDADAPPSGLQYPEAASLPREVQEDVDAAVQDALAGATGTRGEGAH